MFEVQSFGIGRDKCIVWMNWNDSSSISGLVLSSRFLTRLLTNDEEGFERVSVLKEDTSSTACELTMLILSTSVTFSVACLTVTFLITKSCQQRWPIHSCSFYKQTWVRWLILGYTWSQFIISVCNSERIIKIGQYLAKSCSNEKGSIFSDSQCKLTPPRLAQWCDRSFCHSICERENSRSR